MKKIILLSLFAISVLSVSARPFTVTGTVIDKENEPLVGALITEKGTINQVYADVDGKFRIVLADTTKSNTLVFSFIGYRTQEYKVTSKNNITIVLQEEALSLNEVVVTGIRSVDKKMFTGAASSVSASKTVGEASKVRVRGAASTTSRKKETSSSNTSPRSGTLTAGEVNDFAKWHLWNSYLDSIFAPYLRQWNFSPTQRYTAQLTNAAGMPVVNAAVSLQNDLGETIWQTKTDNTGKAELWSNYFLSDKRDERQGLKLVFQYDGKTTETPAIEFNQGINSAKIDADCSTSKSVDLFFMVDATGSMSDEIAYLQAELNDIIKKVHSNQKDLDLRIGSLVYRDVGDAYLTRKSSLNSNVKKTLDFLEKQYADGGGDYPEAVDEALVEAIQNEDWNENALARIAFLVLDAPSHTSPDVLAKLQTQIRLAAQKGIRIVPIACSDIKKDGEYLMRVIALATNGTYLFLTDDSGVGNAHIKPSTDKYEVEKLNDAIVRIIQQYTKMPDCDNKKWASNNIKEEETDKFVPNPYDENPEKDVAKLTPNDVIKIYPNPCKDFLKIEVKKSDIQDVYLVDMTGKSLYSFKTKSNNDIIDVNVSTLATGIYFVKAFYKGKWFSQKIIVKN
jgi:hypothetical protein